MKELHELISIYKPVNVRFDVCYWSASRSWCVTFRDGGETLLEEQGPDFDACIDRMMERARAKKNRKRSMDDLLS